MAQNQSKQQGQAKEPDLNQLRKVRREKLAELVAEGKNPFEIVTYDQTQHSQEIKDNYAAFEDKEVSVAGRLMSKRVMGKASFGHIQDLQGTIQIYASRDDLGEDYKAFKRLDIGDIIGVKGIVFTTKMGEISIHVKSLTVLSKSLRPLPIVKEKDGVVYDAFSDPELRYRQRYVDLIVNPQVRETFVQRTKIINTMRSFFNEQGYLEVETPVLQVIPGGAAARPFITHHNALDMELYLRIADELYLKRLIVGGYAGVYEFSRNFRNEGIDRTHNPEFTCMEIYVAYKDYNWMMTFTENMLERIALALHGTTKVNVWGNDIDFKPPFRRAPMCQLIKEETGVDVASMNEDELREACKRLGVETDATMGKGKLIDAIFGEKCEGKLIQPTFVTDYPIEMSPLCKRHRDNPELTERFELFVCGKELANAYSELNDPIDQLGRFQEQLRLSEKGDDEAMFIDMDFVRALEYGMPPTSGMGIGIDRLVMMMTGAQSIQDVLLFPQMKPEVHEKSSENEGADLTAHGVDEAWVPVLQKAGVKTYDELKAANPNKLFNDLGGLRKKMKLDIPALKREQFDAWLND